MNKIWIPAVLALALAAGCNRQMRNDTTTSGDAGSGGTGGSGPASETVTPDPTIDPQRGAGTNVQSGPLTYRVQDIDHARQEVILVPSSGVQMQSGDDMGTGSDVETQGGSGTGDQGTGTGDDLDTQSGTGTGDDLGTSADTGTTDPGSIESGTTGEDRTMQAGRELRISFREFRQLAGGAVGGGDVISNLQDGAEVTILPKATVTTLPTTAQDITRIEVKNVNQNQMQNQGTGTTPR